MSTLGKRVCWKRYRGFESHPVRHFTQAQRAPGKMLRQVDENEVDSELSAKVVSAAKDNPTLSAILPKPSTSGRQDARSFS